MNFFHIPYLTKDLQKAPVGVFECVYQIALKDTCNWVRIDEDKWIKKVMTTIFQNQLSKISPGQLEIGKPLIQSQGTCGCIT